MSLEHERRLGARENELGEHVEWTRVKTVGYRQSEVIRERHRHVSGGGTCEGVLRIDSAGVVGSARWRGAGVETRGGGARVKGEAEGGIAGDGMDGGGGVIVRAIDPTEGGG